MLLDIEGTTTPLAFLHDVLFSYARERVQNHLSVNGHVADVERNL
jgi:methionine salvage enolase-phosphatase E1